MKDFIYEHAHSMSKGNPACKLFYVTTGNWCDDLSLKSVIDRNIQEITSTNLFSHISVIWANSWLCLRQFNSRFIAQVEGHPPMGPIRHTRVIGIDPIE